MSLHGRSGSGYDLVVSNEYGDFRMWQDTAYHSESEPNGTRLGSQYERNERSPGFHYYVVSEFDGSAGWSYSRVPGYGTEFIESHSDYAISMTPQEIGTPPLPESRTEVGPGSENRYVTEKKPVPALPVAPPAVPAEVAEKVGQAASIQNPYERKVVPYLDGSKRPEPSSSWTKRIFDIRVTENMGLYNMKDIDVLHKGYGLFVEAAAHALTLGAKNADIERVIGQNRHVRNYRAAQGWENAWNNGPDDILREAENLLKNRLKAMQDGGQLQNLKLDDLRNTAFSALFDAMSDLQKAQFIRNVQTNPFLSGPVVHTGPQKGPKLPSQVPHNNTPPKTIRTTR